MNPNVHDRVHDSPPPSPIQTQSVHSHPSSFFYKIHVGCVRVTANSAA